MFRGNDGQNIYLNDADRDLFLETINVPRSVLSEGYKILLQEKTKEYWTVAIEKQ